MFAAEHALSDGRILRCEAPTQDMADQGLATQVEREESKLRWGTDDATLAGLADLFGSMEIARQQLALVRPA
ncbi:hypothetical protein [Rhizorhabdus wittichii]|uniref:hypothetical protein n=1 Tax=Rhizorhabdus wittichii TaxID=160791 RepID=UPI00035D43B2|nr:hypothetical protein [Rhizorhabdus wittichii]